ncbi:MAG TPA: heparinase II/III family protein [Planctomycetota bacterium]|nr:heparinase II/III family protein [Planctomycetota bacterium]
MTLKIADVHPRVMVRPEDLPRLRRIAQTTHKAEYEALLKLAAEGGNDADPKSDGAHTAWRLAFLYLLSGERKHAEAAVKSLRFLGRDISGGYFEAQRRIRACAFVYDWCFNEIDAHLRQRIAHCAIAHTHGLHANDEIWPDNHVAGHEVNMMPHILAAGVAFGDEVYGARPMLEDAFERTKKMIECYGYFLEKDCFQQSYPYTAAYVPELSTIFEVVDKAFGTNWFKEYGWFKNAVTWWTHALRSDDTFIRYGDYFGHIPVLVNAGYYRAFVAAASRCRDPLAQWWVNRFKVNSNEPDVFIFEDRENPPAPKEPGTLPRTRLFERMGIAIARDWGDGTVAALKCSPIYLHNHCHRDQNQITIYHKGDQAIDSGYYDGYETPHWYNYYIRTVAHNTIVVRDPDEKFISRGKEYANDGGQRFLQNGQFWSPRTIEHLKSESFRDGRIAAWREGEGFAYVCGDASNCYSPQKLKKFLRHCVFALDWPHKGAVSLFIVDELELAKPLTPQFLLHTVDEPQVEGARVLAKYGKGRLSTHVLLPNAAKIEKIGGPGKEFVSDGQNYPLATEPKGPMYPGAWRVEIAPPGPVTSMRFVTVLNPADVDAAQESAPQLREEDGSFYITQGDLSVAFLKREGAPPATGKRAISVVLAS